MRDQVKSAPTLNNSKGGTPAPTTCVNNAIIEVRTKRISENKALNANFSDQPITYSVEVIGKSCNEKEFRISNVYEEYHPLMAIGRAVVEFRKAIIVGSIEHILVSERVVSTK